MSRRKGLQSGHLCRNIILAGPHGLQRAVQKPVQLPAKAFRALADDVAGNKIKALTLFATHYFELTQLPEKMEGVANVHLDALEHGDTIAFMHSVQDGAASKSYGLAVAALAGVPKEVIKRARQKLRELESISPNAAATQVDGTQMSLLSVPEETSPAVEALENLDPDSLTPRQALEWIYRLKSLV